MTEITQLLDAAAGDRQAAAELLPLVYDELRKLAAAGWRPRPPATPSTPPLVHEAYLRLVGDQHFDGRGHFFAAAAEAMRRILVDHARDRSRLKRGGGRVRRRVARPGRLPRRGPRPRSCRWTSCSTRLGAEDAAAAQGRPPAPVRRALRRGGGRGAGALPGGGLPELEVRPGLAPRGPGKIIRNPRDDSSPGRGIEGQNPIPEVNHGRRPRTREIPVPEPHRTSPTRRSGPPTWTASAAATPSSGPGSRRCSPPTTGPAGSRNPTPPACPSRPRPNPGSDPDVRPGTAVAPSEPATGRTSRPDAATTPRSPGTPPADRPGGFVAGQVIAGRYTLLEVLGEGGMGTVYRAEQTEPVKRQVALKLIKIGMDSRAVLARFDAERQALALMDHPNIARVYDGGTTDGRPAVLRDGAGQGRADHRVLRPAAALGAGPAGAVRRRLPGGAARPPEGDHPPRPEARQRAGHRGRRPADAQGHRLRRGQGDRVQAHRPEPRRTPGRSSARRRTCRPSRPTRRRWTSTPAPTSMPWA